MNKKLFLFWIALAMAGLACQLAIPFSSPTAVPQAAPATALPAQNPTPTPTQAVVNLPYVGSQDSRAPQIDPTQAAEMGEALRQRILQGLPATPTPDPNGGFASGISEITVLPLNSQRRGASLWMAYSTGNRGYDPPQPHFVAIYTNENGIWRELARLGLENQDIMQNVQQIDGMPVEASSDAVDGATWLMAQGVIGAHGGCSDFLYFDGETLTDQLSGCNSTPYGAMLQDVDGDGVAEILLDQSDYYVFCYACGVVDVNYQVWRVQNDRLVQVGLSLLPRPAPKTLIDLNDQAVRFAQANLWLDAQSAINQAVAQSVDDPAISWNAAWINFMADQRRKALGYSSFPMLSNIFLGDYASALDSMRPYSPQEIFSATSPLIAGSPAEGFQPSLIHYLMQYTEDAMNVNYDMAAAHFFHAWARYLQDPQDPQILWDLQSAVDKDNSERLYANCLAWWQATH